MGKCIYFYIRCSLTCLFALSLFYLTTADGSNKFQYSSKEKDALDKFRSMVEPELYADYMKTDAYLIKWIRNQNFDLQKAKGKLSKSLKWRQENKIDAILHEDFTDLERACPSTLDARDKLGQPVMTVDIGKCSFRKILVKGQAGQLRRLSYYFLERGFRAVAKLQSENKAVAGIVYLIDYNGFSLREHGCIACIPMYIEVATAYEAHYPRLYSRIIGINAPKAFRALLDSLWPFFPEEFKSVYGVYGHDRNEWQAVILQLIDADQIPRQFGGNKK